MIMGMGMVLELGQSMMRGLNMMRRWLCVAAFDGGFNIVRELGMVQNGYEMRAGDRHWLLLVGHAHGLELQFLFKIFVPKSNVHRMVQEKITFFENLSLKITLSLNLW